MRIDSMLTLDISDKDGATIQALCKQLTYSNPKYHEAKRLGFSTYGIPAEIKNYSILEDGRFLVTTRGEIRKVRTIWPDEILIDRAIPYLPLSIEYKNADFNLDERQARAIKAIKAKKQGIIHAATSAGKSAIIMAAIAERKVRTIVVVHRKILLKQLMDDAKKWLPGVSIGQIGDGRWDFDAHVTFAIDKSLASTLARQPYLTKKWEMVIQDECHLSPCGTFQNIINKLDAPFRYGLTGTLKRKDGMEFLIHATYGEVIATITKDELLDADRVSPVEVNIVETETEVDPVFFELPTTKRWQAIDKSLHENLTRQELVMHLTGEILDRNPEARIVVLSRYVKPCYDIGDLLLQSNMPPVYVTGKEQDPSEACKYLLSGRARAMCATIGCFSTGVNIPNLTDIILISPIFNNELLLKQIYGRLMRKSVGKTHGTLHIIFDKYVFSNRQLARMKYLIDKP